MFAVLHSSPVSVRRNREVAGSTPAEGIKMIYMGIKIIKKNEGVTRKISETYKVTNLLTKDFSDRVSITIGEATKHSETTKNIRSDRTYYVLDGKLIVEKDNKKFVAEKGDVIFISHNTEYHFQGSFKAVLVCSPAFSSEDERMKL